jgi:hypothetical protein
MINPAQGLKGVENAALIKPAANAEMIATHAGGRSEGGNHTGDVMEGCGSRGTARRCEFASRRGFHGQKRRGKKASSTHMTAASPEIPSAIQTFCCGVQSRVTSKLPDLAAAPSCDGSTFQPLANPSMSVDPPSDGPPDTDAFQPLF